MTRLHPDDIQAIAERVVFLLNPPSPAGEVSDLDEFRIRKMAREDLARAKAKRKAA